MAQSTARSIASTYRAANQNLKGRFQDMAEYSITVHGLTGRMWKGDNKHPSSRGPAQKILISQYSGGRYFKVELQFDDTCGNGHCTFSITGEEGRIGARDCDSCGCLHDEIAQRFPQLAKYIKWHSVSTDGPMHYIQNTLYFAGDRDCHGRRKGEASSFEYGEGKKRELEAARNAAVWPDATDEQLMSEPETLKSMLEARLPGLMAEFRADMEELGFDYEWPAGVRK